MGLAEVIERPRNKIQCSNNCLFGIVVGADNTYMACGANASAGAPLLNRANEFPYPIVIERIWCTLSSNALSGGSTNTLTLEVAGSDESVMTLVSATNIYSNSNLNIAVAARVLFGFRINSDSAGNANCRQIGYTARAVGA